MKQKTGIKWCDLTSWNCMHGCTQFTPGCDNCYALWLTYWFEYGGHPRWPNHTPLKGKGLTYPDLRDGKPEWTGKITLSKKKLRIPHGWKEPLLIFGNSMFDLFHEQVPLEWITAIFDQCRRCSWHQFMWLTKRSKRMLKLDPQLNWPPNVWMGVSIESDEFVHRADHLRGIGAAVKFISAEPLIKACPSLGLGGIDQLIVGGESGPGFRPMKMEWVEELLEKCRATGTAFFAKQDASRGDGTKGRFKDYPHLWIQEWPMPGPNNDSLRQFYLTTKGRTAHMASRLK